MGNPELDQTVGIGSPEAEALPSVHSDAQDGETRSRCRVILLEDPGSYGCARDSSLWWEGSSFAEIRHDVQRGSSVPRSKMIPVVQIVKELVQLQALLKSWGFRDFAMVCRVKGVTEAPEHAGYCQLIF